jgi:hypothetical protein
MAVATPSNLFEEITDFLASAPSFEQMLAFKPSEKLDQRLHELLDRNSQGYLSAEERTELDEFLRMSHLLKMIKIKVRFKLKI